jgi:hypothetical protein
MPAGVLKFPNNTVCFLSEVTRTTFPDSYPEAIPSTPEISLLAKSVSKFFPSHLKILPGFVKVII